MMAGMEKQAERSMVFCSRLIASNKSVVIPRSGLGEYQLVPYMFAMF